MELDLLFKVAGVGIAAAFLHTILEQLGKKEFAQWVTLFGFLYVLLTASSFVGKLFDQLRTMFLP